MDWEQVRAHYERTFRAQKAAGRTQAEIADLGGFRRGRKSQNAISKLMKNSRQGPRVTTLLKAIDGLGMPASVFFAQIENGDAPTGHVPTVFVSHRADDDDLAWLRGIVQAFRAAVDQKPRAASPHRTPKRRARRAS